MAIKKIKKIEDELDDVVITENEEPIDENLEPTPEDELADPISEDDVLEGESPKETSLENDKQPIAMPAVLKCNKCGEEVVVEDPVCPVCGTKLRILDHLQDLDDDVITDEIYPALDTEDDVLPKSSANRSDEDLYSGLTYNRDPYE